MRAEALEAPQAVARLLMADDMVYAALAGLWRAQPAASVLTLARGSSDHAASYLAYLVMARLQRLVTSLPMSVMTLYASPLRTEGLWSLALSQSGRSPDLVEPTRALRQRGACTLAIVNDADSPLADAAEWVLPLHAGPEHGVAATKSFIAQMVVGARLVAGWGGDVALARALGALPQVLERAATVDWSAGIAPLQRARSLYVVGRGPGLAVAMEAALKLKETCGLHAEALSAAELHHGPKALLGSGFAVLVVAPRGPAQAGLLEAAAAFRSHGAQVLVAAPPEAMPSADGLVSATCSGTLPADVACLPLVSSGHEDLDAISAVQSFYPFADALARARGFDPDAPRHLAKVTLTR